jgi:hypothetical protein
MNVNQSRENQHVPQICFLVSVWHLRLFAYFEDFAVFNGYAAVNYFLVQVRLGVC